MGWVDASGSRSWTGQKRPSALSCSRALFLEIIWLIDSFRRQHLDVSYVSQTNALVSERLVVRFYLAIVQSEADTALRPPSTQRLHRHHLRPRDCPVLRNHGAIEVMGPPLVGFAVVIEVRRRSSRSRISTLASGPSELRSLVPPENPLAPEVAVAPKPRTPDSIGAIAGEDAGLVMPLKGVAEADALFKPWLVRFGSADSPKPTLPVVKG